MDDNEARAIRSVRLFDRSEMIAKVRAEVGPDAHFKDVWAEADRRLATQTRRDVAVHMVGTADEDVYRVTPDDRVVTVAIGPDGAAATARRLNAAIEADLA